MKVRALIAQAQKVQAEVSLMLSMLESDDEGQPEVVVTRSGDTKKPPPGVPPGRP